MSEPDVDWYVQRIRAMLREIDNLVSESIMTNSKRDIIYFNVSEIEIDLYIVMRKLKANFST
jgi:hypothetical protein